jgi:hypothetical protein
MHFEPEHISETFAKEFWMQFQPISIEAKFGQNSEK